MRTISHTQFKEPFLEYILSEIRFKEAEKYIKHNTIVGDVGCGYNGNHIVKLSGKIRRGVGYDISISNKKLPKNIRLKSADINKDIDSKRNYFDTITALAVLEHVEDPKVFIKKLRKMIRKNGSIIITTPHKNGKLILEILSKIGLISRDEIDDHKNYFDKKTLVALFDKKEFKIKKIGVFGLGWLNLICVAKSL